jgi:hypothetical protein
MGYLVLITAMIISGIAAWYSIIGLMAIFSAAVIPIAIMGGVLEIGKLVTASWLYQYWKKIPRTLKAYLTTAVVVLMFITSMGIFGFLSKAHIDQSILTGDNSLLITQLNNRIKREQRKIVDADKVIGQLDSQVQTLIEYDRIRGPSGSIATRKSQQVERDSLNKLIETTAITIGRIQEQRIKLDSQKLKLEADVGPIRYIAAFVYEGKANREMLETAVRWVIIVIIFVFDPLAILLLIAANMTLKEQYEKKKRQNARKKHRQNKLQKVIISTEEDGNAVSVKEDPYLANTQIWEEADIVIKKKEESEMVAVGEEYDIQTRKDSKAKEAGDVIIKKPR